MSNNNIRGPRNAAARYSPGPERCRPIQKRGMRRGADVRELHGSAKPKQAARSECDAVERSAAKALCRSLPQANGEELAAKGRQL
jgi:hypothetical protein